MIATQLPPIRIFPIGDIGPTHPIGRLCPYGPDTRKPSWWLCGGHNGSRLTAARLGAYTDRNRPPTPQQIAEALPTWKPCDCRRCRRVCLVWAWWGGQAVDLAHSQRLAGASGPAAITR